MAESSAGSEAAIRQFSTSEEAVLRREKIDPAVAAEYPDRFPVGGVCEMIAAGIEPDRVRSVAPVLTARAVVAFVQSGADMNDVDYSDRFLDPRLLAEAGIGASKANLFPPELSEVDVVRLHESGATPDLIVEFDDAWEPVDIAKLVASGVAPSVARPYRPPSVIPTDLVSKCAEAGVRPDDLVQWVGVVGNAVRTERHALVSMALDSSRRADPNGFRGELLSLAIKSIDAASDGPPRKQALMDALSSVIARGGELSTSIPNSWNRRRHLYVGPLNAEVAVITVAPNEPLLCADGETSIEDGLVAIREYADGLSG